jgi:hypothetical protein
MRLKPLLILLTALAFWGCTKGEDANVDPVNFSMEGLKDVTLVSDSLKSDSSISINVIQTSGKAEEISLSVSDLPAGVQATFSPAKGVPPFSTMLRLAKISSTKAGTYSVSINAKSASFSNSGTINLTIPELNGWTFDGIDHEQFWMPWLTNQGNPTRPMFEPNLSDVYWGTTRYAWAVGIGNPFDADGVYTYKIINYYKGEYYVEGEIAFQCADSNSSGRHTYYSVPSGEQYATIKVSGSKYSITAPPIEMYENGDTTKPMKILSVNAWMK